MTLTTFAKTSLLTASVLLAAAGSARASEWELDPAHTTAQFSVKHMMVTTVRGVFDKVTGSVKLDDADPTKSSIEITIDANTINTREPKRDAHLRSPDFFDVAKNPTITFKSTAIQKVDASHYNVTGNLTMRGVTRPVTLAVEAPATVIKNPWGVPVRSVSATGKINRKDWGLTWNKALEAGGFLVGDEVTINFDAEMNPKAPPAKAAAAATTTPASTAAPAKK
jgi:polyisoprenoid-binding protein YceI